MEAAVSPLPDDIEALKALLASATRRADEAEAKLANAHARESATEAVIAHLKLQIAKLKREQYGASAERTRRLLDQMELQLEDLEADAAEDDLAAEAAAEKTSTVTAFERRRPARKQFPEELPRERVTPQLARLSRNHDLAKAINYMLRRWNAFTRFLDDGRVCLTNNAAERALRCVPLGRKAWLFCGSDRGGQRAALIYTLIQTAKLNDVDPQAWLADVLARIAEHPARKLDELLPWNWQQARRSITA
ncbi:MAG: transposase [Novosphingobium sp.]|uniref:IS66 family transposase n=1 Tax=Novosphingobium sp. TaxID=1874826 RepID=UPI003015D034